jgi:hypothetical protein
VPLSARAEPRAWSGTGADRALQHRPLIPFQLRINPPGDRFERQAADASACMSGMPVPALSRVAEADGSAPSAAPSLVEEAIASDRGRPLDAAARSFLESRFGRSFSAVRVHTDDRSAASTRAVNALAYTVGSHIVFAPGQYAPERPEGRKLIAHELAHVVQQDGLAAPSASAEPAPAVLQRQEPVTTVSIGAVAAKCIIGAIVGALFDAGIQAALSSWRRRSWRFWETSLNWCSIILSAILGCIAAPISAAILEPWIVARLGTRLGGLAGTLIGKILLFIAKKLSIGIPKAVVGKLLKLNCISAEQSAELGVPVEAVA